MASEYPEGLDPSVLVGDGGKSWYQTQRRNQQSKHPQKSKASIEIDNSRSKLTKKQERNRLKRLKKKQRQQQHKNRSNDTSHTTKSCNPSSINTKSKEDTRSSFLYGNSESAHTLDSIKVPQRRRINPFAAHHSRHPRPKQQESNFKSMKRNTNPSHRSRRPDNRPGFKTYRTSSNQEELNQISAKILKAKLSGNDALCLELEKQRDALREEAFEIEHQYVSNPPDHDRSADQRPVSTSNGDDDVYGPKGGDQVELILDGKMAKQLHGMEETKGINDDDDIETMLKKERNLKRTGSDFDLSLVKNRKLNKIQQSMSHSDDRFDAIDNVLLSNDKDPSKKRKRGQSGDNEERMRLKKRARVISEHRQRSSWFSSCAYCTENEEVHRRDMAHCVVYYGQTLYLAVPKWRGLVPFQCVIVPNEHIKSFREGLDCNEEIGASKEEQKVFDDELNAIKKLLCKMFREKFDSGVLFIETVRNLKRNYHSVIHCYPMEMELFNLCPVYFEKAILESDVMWSTNKRLVTTTKEKPLRASIPQYMAYFHVQFGCDEGFVHVIEDETKVKQDFGAQIVAGIVGEVLFKIKKDGYRQQRERADAFKSIFRSFKKELDEERKTQERDDKAENEHVSSTTAKESLSLGQEETANTE